MQIPVSISRKLHRHKATECPGTGMFVVPPYLPRQNGGTISFRSLRQRWYLEMMTVKTCSALIFSLSTLFAAQEASAPVPVENEPLHHVVLKNESVVVIHLTLPPGERTLYHTHSHDRIAVPLSGTSYTHRVHNVGANPYDVLDIELLVRPQSPSPATVAPVAAENPSARIYNWVLAPGAMSAMHTHGRPYLIVAATEITLKMKAPDGLSLTYDLKRGAFHWVDNKVTHTLANLGSGEGQILEIELK